MPNDGYYYCLNCHSEITPDYNEHCCFCGSAAVAVSGDYSPEEVETAFDLLNKQQQGLVIVPPCKVGYTVYTNFAMSGWYFRNKDKPYPAKVVFVGLNDSKEMGGGLINVVYGKHDYMMQFSFSDIGKSVFLTREEAEQALKEGADNG